MGDHLEITHRLSEGTKNLLRDLFGCNLEQKIDRLIELLEAGVNIPDLGFINAKLDLIQGLIENEGPITNLTRKVDEFMATQEERLRGVKAKLDAIQSGVDKIQQQLADLKTNNPELEDEISAIEATAAAIDTDVNPVTPEQPTEPTP